MSPAPVDTVTAAAWFFLPAFIANGAPPVLAQLPVLKHWDTPIDFGATWNGEPVFGSHKTWRGLFGGVVLAGVTGWIQSFFTPYSVTFAVVLGFGALLGDAVKSFAKRRVGVEPGGPWIPFDEVDYVLGGFAAAWILGQFNTSYFLVILVLGPVLSVLANHVMYWIGAQDAAW